MRSKNSEKVHQLTLSTRNWWERWGRGGMEKLWSSCEHKFFFSLLTIFFSEFDLPFKSILCLLTPWSPYLNQILGHCDLSGIWGNWSTFFGWKVTNTDFGFEPVWPTKPLKNEYQDALSFLIFSPYSFQTDDVSGNRINSVQGHFSHKHLMQCFLSFFEGEEGILVNFSPIPISLPNAFLATKPSLKLINLKLLLLDLVRLCKLMWKAVTLLAKSCCFLLSHTTLAGLPCTCSTEEERFGPTAVQEKHHRFHFDICGCRKRNSSFGAHKISFLLSQTLTL